MTTIKAARDTVLVYIEHIIEIFGKDSTRPLGMYLALTCISWGVWLLLPFDTFSGATVFSALKSIHADEIEWGLMFLVAGMVELYAIASGDFKSRKYGALLMVFLWVFMTTTGAISAVSSLALVTYTLNALSSFWISVRLWSRSA